LGYEPTDTDEHLLRSAYRSSLILANAYELSTVAFSSISTGHYNYAAFLAAPVAVSEILSFLNSPENTSIRKVIMVCYTDLVKDAFDDALADIMRSDDQPAEKDPSRIVLFYRGLTTDDQGRYIQDIWEYGHFRLEISHNYIQWLFPTKERSRYNENAPVLTDTDIAIIRHDPIIQANMLYSLQAMLSFYGLALDKSCGIVIHKAPNFLWRSSWWLNKGNHNFLRITRILKSLRLFGLGAYADAFLKELRQLHKTHRAILTETMSYWEATQNP